MPDDKFLKRRFKLAMGYDLNLDAPKTFNEKLQCLKLYDRRPEYTIMVDKVAAKEYVAGIIGENYIIPTFGVWDDPDDIEFDALPKQFVLKCNHNSGKGMCICKNKDQLDIDAVKVGLRKGLKENIFFQAREWPYKNVSRKILAEKYMADNVAKKFSKGADGLIDYKFYCFNGEPKFLYVGFANIEDGNKRDLLSFFDFDLNPTPFYRTDHAPFPYKLTKPRCMDDMVEIARRLSHGIPFVRVDMYALDGQPYFSEFTFYPGGGFGKFNPSEWELQLGEWISLPSKINLV